uniref:ABC transporter permease n=1 Tax=Neogoniolithon spectabile TaxID=231755 RepID=A0A3G3MH29_9FLOR|nr:hypothetical protein [Neogoniolithon spectabile]AYR06135.1 hypothetical protein [Neogoniolithon spectabile]
MLLLKTHLNRWLQRMYYFVYIAYLVVSRFRLNRINLEELREQIKIVGVESLGISLITSFFIGMVFTLQLIKEFLYLDASSLIGAVLSLAFIRELAPVLTSVILAGKIGSSFTAELATMQVTDQIDALYLLRTDPVTYLVLPRIVACVLALPLLNVIFFLTSLASSLFLCNIFYSIHPEIFLRSILLTLSYKDIIKSTFKVIVFSFILSSISCSWGLYNKGGAKSVGESTTSSVVTNLLMIFYNGFLLVFYTLLSGR